MTLVENTQISNLGTIAVSDASCRTLEAHSTLKEQQAEKFSQKASRLTRVDVTSVSCSIFLCKCSKLPRCHGRGCEHKSLPFCSMRSRFHVQVDSIVWTSEAQANLLTPQQHKVAFRDVVAEKAIRYTLIWLSKREK